MNIDKDFTLRDLTLLALLLALMIVTRIGLSILPSVQLISFTTFLIGVCYGKRIGALFGILSTILTSIFLGFGIWVIFQAIGWAVFGIVGDLCKNSKLYIKIIIIVLISYLYGQINNLSMLIYGIENIKAYIVIALSSLPYDTTHAITNAVLVLILEIPLEKLIYNYKRKQ